MSERGAPWLVVVVGLWWLYNDWSSLVVAAVAIALVAFAAAVVERHTQHVARGRILDRFAAHFDLERLPGESDDSLRTRIRNAFRDPRSP